MIKSEWSNMLAHIFHREQKEPDKFYKSNLLHAIEYNERRYQKILNGKGTHKNSIFFFFFFKEQLLWGILH